MKLLYVSGKYTDTRGTYFVHANIEEARRVSAILWALGIPSICPHANTYHLDGVTDYETFMQGDLLMVDRCDGLIALPNHVTSSGSRREIIRNEQVGHTTFYWPHQLPVIVDFVFPDGVAKDRLAAAYQLTIGDESAHLNRCRVK